MTQKFKNKVAIVTGSSKGIGAEIAKHLAKEGAAVVVNYSSSKEDAQKVVTEINKNGGKAIAVQANLAKPQEIEKLFKEASKAFGKLDILINNAGVYEFASLEELTLEHYHKIFDLNVMGLIFVTKEALKHIGPSGGSIVNISSLASTFAPANFSVYSASKAAVDTLTKSLAKELGPKKIRVNCVNPGVVITEGTQKAGIADAEFRRNIEVQTPLGRVGVPADIATAVAFLASDEASWITGETLFISGGFR